MKSRYEILQPPLTYSNGMFLFACKCFSVLFEWCFPRQYSHNLSNYVRRKNIEFLNPPYWKIYISKIPIFFETLFSTTEMWFFYERCSSSKTPIIILEVRSITFPLIANIGSFKGMLPFWRNLWKGIYFVFPSFNNSLLALNQTAMLFSSRFTLLKRSLMLLRDEKRFVSSANIIDCRILETL